MVSTIQSATVVSNQYLDELTSSVQKTKEGTAQTPATPNENVVQNNNDKNTASQKVDYTGLSKQIQKSLKEDNLMVQFSVDKPSKQIVMKLLDSDTKEVIRQVPPEVALKIAKMVTSFLDEGKITDAKV